MWCTHLATQITHTHRLKHIQAQAAQSLKPRIGSKLVKEVGLSLVLLKLGQLWVRLAKHLEGTLCSLAHFVVACINHAPLDANRLPLCCHSNAVVARRDDNNAACLYFRNERVLTFLETLKVLIGQGGILECGALTSYGKQRMLIVSRGRRGDRGGAT